MKYDIFTLEVNGIFRKTPVRLTTFNTEIEAFNFIQSYAKNRGIHSIAFLKSSYHNYIKENGKEFGIGAIMYCKVREV